MAKIVPDAPTDVLKEHRFLWDTEPSTSAELQAKQFSDKLVKDVAVCQLNRYRDGVVALRWRTQADVTSGKGMSVCGEIGCDSVGLHSFEVPFAYEEQKSKKLALVKLRLCGTHAVQLSYQQVKQNANGGHTHADEGDGDQDHARPAKKSRR